MIDENQEKKATRQDKKKVKRIQLENDPATKIHELVKRLRNDSCKTDASKVVNQILEIYFNKYCEQEYKSIYDQFFDKKKYLKSLLDQKSDIEIDQSIREYLKDSNKKKSKSQKISTNKTV